MSKLHHDKEMVARAYPKEDQAVSSYAARFLKLSAKRKAKNPNLLVENSSTSLAPSDDVGGSTALKPGRKQTDVAKQYLAQYAAMTPQAALKKRLMMSEVEREINEKSKADSYLNQFLEDKADVAPKSRGHVRRSSDSFNVKPSDDGAPSDVAAPKAVVKRDSVRLDGRKRSSSSANLSRSSVVIPTLQDQSKLERKATQEKLLELEQQKVIQVKNAPLARVSASHGAPSSTESSDVEESSSTFESDGESDMIISTKAKSPKRESSRKGNKKALSFFFFFFFFFFLSFFFILLLTSEKLVASPKGHGSSPRKKAPSSAKKRSSSANLKRKSSASSSSSGKIAIIPSADVASSSAVTSATSDSYGLSKSRRVTEEELPKLLKLGNELGKGAFSLVYQAVRMEDNLAVAVKVIDLSRLTAKQLAEVDAERFILQQFHHPNVVNMLNVFETGSRLYYVLELLPGGDLFNKILQRGCFSERATKRIVKQIAEAVTAMHNLGIVHRDLKPENILCIEDSFTKQIDVK